MHRFRPVLLFGALALAALALAASAAALSAVAQAAPATGGAFVVNSSADSADPADEFLTLREAILVANGALTMTFSNGARAQLGGCAWSGSLGSWAITGGCGAGIFDNITFAGAITTIHLSNSLPDLTDDLTTITGTNGVPRLDGAGISKGSVLYIDGNTETIGGLSIVNGPTGTSPAFYADIEVRGNSGTNNRIAGNYLGILPGAAACGAGGVTRNSGNGITVDNNSRGSAADGGAEVYIFGNVIGCHANHGVWVDGAEWVDLGQPDLHVPGRNFIGTTPDGHAIGNGSDGVFIQPESVYSAQHNTLINNLIQYNGGSGVVLSGTATSDNVIGGPTSAERNVISGNALDGVDLEGSGATRNTLLGNFIGLNLTGTAALPNGGAGVVLGAGVAANQVGAITGTDQLIAGNLGPGVLLRLAGGGNSVRAANRIGVGAGDLPLGNGGDGIRVDGAFSATLTPNLIAYNGGAGIVISGAASVGDSAVPLVVYGNAGLPLDLGGDGHTPNGAHVPPGPNHWLNYPLITSASGSVVTGTAPANSLVEYFAAIGDPSAARGGGTFLGVVLSDGSGRWTVTLPGGRTRADVTLLAYDLDTGDSSEFSPRPTIALPIVMR